MPMKKIVIGGLLGLSLILTACGSNQEGDAALKGKTFEATQGGDNEYLLTFRDDGTLQVKENGNLGRTDEGEYKVSEEKSKDGYYHVTFDKLEQGAGYVNDEPTAGYWALDKDNNNNPVLRYVKKDCLYNPENMKKKKCKITMSTTDKSNDDSLDVYLKEK